MTLYLNLNDPSAIRRAAQQDLLPAAFVAKLLAACERLCPEPRLLLADGTEVPKLLLADGREVADWETWARLGHRDIPPQEDL